MRKNSPRKWLHAILDLLPVILIPVFMIYSHRHTIDSYSVTRQERENQPYNFYQGIYNGKPTSTENWEKLEEYNILTYDDESQTMNFYFDIEGNLIVYGKVDIDYLDKLYLSINISNYVSNDLVFDLTICTEGGYEFYPIEQESITYNTDKKYATIYQDLSDHGEIDELSYLYLTFTENNQNDIEIYIKNVQIFNLTQIFGSGNEPSQEEFESMLTQDYYEYGNNYVDNYVIVSKTYNDTDIMSQFTYNLYNSVDKYFNMNNVFGMNNVYTWFETNIFHGTAPLYIYIVWNIVLYEFVMDLLMLLYSLFMWFIDMCQNLIDRCYSSSKGGN